MALGKVDHSVPQIAMPIGAVRSHVASGWPVARWQTKTAERYALQGGGSNRWPWATTIKIWSVAKQYFRFQAIPDIVRSGHQAHRSL